MNIWSNSDLTTDCYLVKGVQMTAVPPGDGCPWCGPWIMHCGACPKVKEFEFWPDGRLKRVVFHDR